MAPRNGADERGLIAVTLARAAMTKSWSRTSNEFELF
jgi:hypothetical protein